MKVVSVVGARPQFVKLAPVAVEFRNRNIDHSVIHTGQHYDESMSAAFFADFSLGAPETNLGVGSGSHAAQTAAILAAIEPELLSIDPDWVLVYGDTNSTLAATLAASKLQMPVAHLEAGLRSFNRAMPEEHNRVLTDHSADLLLAPTENAVRNLTKEGLASRSVLVGDVMADVCLAAAKRVRVQGLTSSFPEDYVLATLHRPYNTDDQERLSAIVGALSDSPIPVLLPAHPRLAAMCRIYGIDLARGSIRVVSPLRYDELITAVIGARTVITDSGGLQKEAYILGRTCTTIRSETEWIETTADGWNTLRFEGLSELMTIALRPKPDSPGKDHYGSGTAASSVAEALLVGHDEKRAS
jgi:UDP-N-acetylglucosamine 2-epimerase (non-hydrolysing)